MYIGVDYYPEHWAEEMIDHDLKRITEMGCNMVRIGEFAWHLMEPHDGEIDFTYFDQVLTKIKKYHLKVMFGTPTATFPAWLVSKYPEILSKSIDGQVRSFGGRRQYCYTSDIYRRYACRITERLVSHYAHEPTIIAWQVDNELGHEGSDMCYCERCHVDFQDWLSTRYQDIHELNDRWGTIFWGQTYNHFSEIPLPTHTITVHNPSHQLEWMRYRSFTLNRYAKEQIAIVKDHCDPHQQVTTNASGGFFNKYFDHEEHFRELDFSSYDNYPVWGGLAVPMPAHQIAMCLDFMRGLRGEHFWIVEQLMGAQGHDVIGYLPRPNQAKMWAHQAFAHGCKHMLWFRWRGMTRGAEQFCYGIIDHDDQKGRRYHEVKDYISFIQPYQELVDAPIQSDIAILYDYDNVWSWRIQSQSGSFDFFTEMAHLYKPFYKLGQHVDVIPADRQFSNYKVLLVPNLMIVDTHLARRLRDFVHKGGRLIMTYRSAIKDRDNNIHFKKSIPCLLDDVIGARVVEVESLGAQTSVEIRNDQDRSIGRVWRDMLQCTTAQAIEHYDDEFKSYACITKNKFGSGIAYYIGSHVEPELLLEIANEIADDLQMTTISAPEGLEVYPRQLNDKQYYFVCNHTNQTLHWAGRAYGPYGVDVVMG